MAEYIRKEDATKIICEWGTRQERIGRYAVTIHELKQNTADMLDELPSADVAPAVHSRWIKTADGAECENCGREAVYQIVDDHWEYENFCPNCGAKMDGKE